MRRILSILLVVIIFVSYSQEMQPSNDSLSLADAISAFESSNDSLSFFYHKEWINGLKIHNEDLQTELPVEEAIPLLLKNTPLNYYLNRNHVILLLNTTIVVPQLSQRTSESSSVALDFMNEVVFQRESSNGGAENRLHIIGNIKNYEKGGNSTIRGKVFSENGPVDGVYVFNVEPFISTISDEQGKFSITLPNGINELNFQSVTTIDTKRRLKVYSDGELEVALDVDVVALEEVIVSTQREKNINSVQMGLTTIDPKQVSILPALLGEKDIIRVATSTAGVQNVGEGSAGINIRGGKADQNLFLIDNNTVFTTNHFFGFFSAFNSRGIGELSLYKNGIPAEYGGRLSSVFDIKTKDPSDEKLEITGGLGLVTSQLQIEGPMKDVKTSFLINGRGTYSQHLLDRFKDSSIGNNDVSFYDFTLKTHTKLSDTDEFAVTAYYSYDAFKVKSDTLLSFSDFSYENKVVGVSWKHIFNDNLFGILEVGNSNFTYLSSYDVLPTQAFNVDLFVNEFRAAAKFDYFINQDLNFKFGIETKAYTISPGKKSPKGPESVIEYQAIDEERAVELAPYISASYHASEKLAIDAGIRYSVFNSYGPAEINTYQNGAPKEPSTVIGTKNFRAGEIIHSNHGPEFRFQGRYLVGAGSSIKVGYGRTRQNIHLLLNAASIAPTDVWRLSGPFIDPQLADQVSVGYFKNFFGEHLIEASVEAYYKDIDNLLDFKTGAELQFNPTIETDLLQGDGKSYGIELSLSKSTGWLSGWLNYTYSRSFVRLDGNNPSEIVNGGVFFPTGYDKPHYFNSVTNYKFTRRLTMTLNMVYSSGIPVTYPVGKWNFKGSENILYSDRNEFRIPNYFRVDLGFNINMSHKLKKFTHSSWTFSIYNLLGRDNIYSIFFEVEDEEINGYQMSIFPTPIPTITYNFKF
ncbi:TonB-dependent receptor plug domain-containing protein [Ekhidna sp.]|uniref:TonB-dependent receptor plug domain-containing protein n=1 Tax=Ekhidna sp. TaxID=2608089 RepID=UPI003CCB95A4